MKNARARRWGAALSIWLAGCACASRADDAVSRFVCTMTDGSVRVMAQNLAEHFGERIARCRPIEVSAAEVQPVAAPSGPSPLALRLQQLMRKQPGPLQVTRRAPGVPSEYAALIREASLRYRIDPDLVAAVMYVESRYNATARSHKGALGLMQLMPATAARYGILTEARILEPAVNIDIGTRYLRDLHDIFDGRVDLVLAAYNAGEGAVTRWGNAIPPFAETQAYVRNIMALLAHNPPRRASAHAY